MLLPNSNNQRRPPDQAMDDAKPLRVKDCYEDAELIFIGPSKPRGWRRSQARSSG